MTNANRVPFFARYLEGQKYPAVKTDLRGGVLKRPVAMTGKYPSDQEDGPLQVTGKYPSDAEG